MNIAINFSGHHVEVTPALKEYATDKLSKLEQLGEKITRISVTFSVQKLSQIAKATLHIKGTDIHASDESTDMYAAIDGLADKLNRQIKKHRDNHTDH
jgi:putative sigma-54 modulation protein